MQLNRKPSICSALTAITATLLGSGAVHAADNGRIESSILLYSETSRVKAAEGVFSLTRFLKKDRVFTVRLSLDGLTGASPNGAAPANGIQTFTRPSGNGSYSAPQGETPLDKTFKDTRVSVDGSLTRPLNRLTSLVFGGHLSGEHDYTSLGGNVGVSRALNRKNTTLSASFAYSHDIVRPIGGPPVPLANMAQPVFGGGGDDDGIGGASRSKNAIDVLFGVTQILNRTTVLRLNYSINHTSGYLNDPYKLVSVTQGLAGIEPGEPVRYINESRPESRNKRAIFAELRHYMRGHTVDLSYRYFDDSWGVRSQTVDFHYHLPLKSGHAIEPHVRWYRQSQANFYQAFLLDGATTPTYVSADYRLAPFHALTVGLKYLHSLAHGTQISIGAEYYQQVGDLSPPSSLGALSQNDLFPKLEAAMVRLGLSYDI